MQKTVDIKGHKWTIHFVKNLSDFSSDISEDTYGLTDFLSKSIYIRDCDETNHKSKNFNKSLYSQIIMHEFFHAFFYESNRDDYGIKYAGDETLIDTLSYNFDLIAEFYKNNTK